MAVAGAGAEIMEKSEPEPKLWTKSEPEPKLWTKSEPEPKINSFSSAKLFQCLKKI